MDSSEQKYSWMYRKEEITRTSGGNLFVVELNSLFFHLFSHRLKIAAIFRKRYSFHPDANRLSHVFYTRIFVQQRLPQREIFTPCSKIVVVINILTTISMRDFARKRANCSIHIPYYNGLIHSTIPGVTWRSCMVCLIFSPAFLQFEYVSKCVVRIISVRIYAVTKCNYFGNRIFFSPGKSISVPSVFKLISYSN